MTCDQLCVAWSKWVLAEKCRRLLLHFISITELCSFLRFSIRDFFCVVVVVVVVVLVVVLLVAVAAFPSSSSTYYILWWWVG